VREALALYGRALVDAPATSASDASGPAGPLVRFEDGALMRFPVARYVAGADPLERELLDVVEGPVLDVGCGPGRHLSVLAGRGLFALGVDLSPVAVSLARKRGGRAMVADVFDELPGAGSWRTALLLDGNIGIGGDPVRLLRRLGALLCDGGSVLLELEPPGSVSAIARARIELGVERSDWFAWARVSACGIAAIAARAEMAVEREWSCGERWFARLRSAGCA
jgi:SAM-dependent methyltransferase